MTAARRTQTLTRRMLMAAMVAAPSVADAAPPFTGHPSIKTIMQAGQSAVCNIADLGRIETLAVVLDGVLVEVHARRNGIYQAKDPARSRSLRTIAPVDVNRLIQAAGGLNQGVNGTPRAPAFAAIIKALPTVATVSGVGAAPAGTLRIAPDAFFAGWAIDYDARNGTYSFAAAGVQAFWKLEGQP